MLGGAAMRLRFLRVPMLVAALLIACSSNDDDDDGCNVGERRCSTHADCEGFAPLDFSILGPSIDARCFRSECVAEKCEATPIPGRLEDERKGDCSRPTCDEEGRLVRTPDRSDAPPRDDDEPCSRSVCEDGLLGGLAAVTRPAPEGSSCFTGSEQGICSRGRCVLESIDEDAGEDAGDDANADASADPDADADVDASTDAATD